MKISKVIRTGSSIKKAIRILTKLPKDEVLTQVELSLRVGCRRNTLGEYANSHSEYTIKLGQIRYWGSPAAIKLLRKQTNL